MNRLLAKIALCLITVAISASQILNASAQNVVRVPEINIEIISTANHCSVARIQPNSASEKLLRAFEQISCKPEIGIFSGNFKLLDQAVKKSVARGESITSCYNVLTDLTCTMSPWAQDKIGARAQKLLNIAKTLKTPYADHGMNSERLLPCLAMRESTLEPASTFENNCTGMEINSRGLFHIELPTLEDLTSAHFGFESQYYPRNNRQPEQYAKFLHDQLDTDIPLQIEIFHATIQRKKMIYSRQQEKETKKTRPPEASLRQLLEMYNGSSQKQIYAESIIQCMSCLKQNKKTTELCLTKAHVSGALSLTRWNRCKRSDEHLALGEESGNSK